MHLNARKFHKTVISFVVLSEDPISAGAYIDDIYKDAINGKFTIKEHARKSTVLNGKQVARALLRQGNDPEFFNSPQKGKTETMFKSNY